MTTRTRRWIDAGKSAPRLLAAAALLLLAGQWSAARAQPAPKGAWIDVSAPLVNKVQAIKSEVERHIRDGARVIIFHFKGEDRTDIESARNLARFLLRDEKIVNVETYAYIDGPLKGHIVLPALACKTIWMGENGVLGPAFLGQGAPSPTRTDMAIYLEIVEGHKPEALVLKMLFPELTVVRSADNTVYRVANDASAKRLEVPAAFVAGDGQFMTISNPGQLGVYPTELALTYGLAGSQKKTPRDVIEALGLDGSVLAAGPLLDPNARVGWIEVRGAIDAGMVSTVRRKINRAIETEKVACVIFEINASGGRRAVESMDELLREVRALQTERKVKTIAFIPRRASGASVYLAFACSEIIMGPNGKLGDCAEIYSDRDRMLGDGELATYRTVLQKLAEETGRSSVVAQALLDPKLQVRRVRSRPQPNNPGPSTVTFLTEADFKKNEAAWIPVDGPFTVKEIDAETAVNWRIAKDRVPDEKAESVLAIYGLNPANMVRLKPDFLDELVNILTHPIATVFLFILGFTCLLLEIKAPGLGLPAIIAAICFLLIFWAHSWLAREVNSLAILLFLLGLVLLGVEIFILPGFGITGISGILLIILSLSLVVLKDWRNEPSFYWELGKNAGIFGASLLVSLVAAYTIGRYLPYIPYANRLVLQPPEADSPEASAPPQLAQTAGLLGAVGVAVTELRPAGKARFGDQYVDVMAEGHYVAAGAKVQIIEIDGLHVVVKALA
jgi:membrane-bound ClpP family serine protease